MRRYKVLQTGDWHNDAGNREFVEPAVSFVADLAERIKPDLVAFAGDAYVHRGAVRPHGIAFNRIAFRRMARASTYGLVAISGNHDQEFRLGMADALTATLSDDVLGIGCDDRIITAAVPQIVRVGPALLGANGQLDPSDLLSLVLVPTPNKYSLAALAAAAGVEDPSSDAIATLVEDAVQGMIQEEVAAGHQPAVVFHSTVRGAKLSNEQVMHAGVDVALSTAAFRGAAVGLGGHIHRPQEMLACAFGPSIFYTGSIAPLNWNEAKLAPVVYLHTLEVDGAVTRLVETETIAVPVASQMIEIYLGADCWEGRVAEDVIGHAIVAAQASAGDRVRLAITAPSAVVAQVTGGLLETVRESRGLLALTAVKEADDLREVRFEAERNIDLLEAARRWAELKGITDPASGPFLDYAAAVEQQIVGEHVDAHFEFLPRRLTVRNWYQHADATIDFNDVGPLIAVTGPNTSGKSNLLRAVPFALFKIIMAGDVLADVVRKGETLASVVLEFASGGREFRIKRTVRVSASGAATATLLLEELLAGGMVEPLFKDDAKATELEIQKLVGPLDLFLATSYAGQSDADSLLDLGPAEFRDLLQSVLQRDFAGRVKIASRDGREAAEARGKLVAARAIHEPQAVHVAGLQQRIADRRLIITALDESLAVDLEPALREQIAAHQATVEDLVARVAAATAAANRHSVLRVEIQAAEDRLAQRRQAARDETTLAESLAALDAVDLAAARAALEAAKAEEAVAREALDRELADRSGADVDALIAGAREGIAAVQAIAAGEADLVAQLATLGPADVFAATEAANTAASKERTAAAELSGHRASPERDRIAGEIASAKTEVSVRASQVKSLEQEIERDTRDAALIATVPCGGQVWPSAGDLPGEGVDMGACKFLAAASAAAAGLPAKAARLADLRIATTNLYAQISEMGNRLVAMAAAHDARLETLTDRYRLAAEACRTADQDLALARASVARRQDLTARISACREAAAKLADYTVALTTLEATRDRLAAERDSRVAGARAAHAGACTASDGAAAEVSRAETVDRQRATLTAALDASRIAAADIAAAESELAQRQQDLERTTADAAALQESSMALGIARAALGKTQGDLEEFRAAKTTRAAQIADAREQNARLEEQLAAGTRAAEEVGRLTGEIVKLQVREATCSLYEQAVGRDGIPQLLLEQYAVPQLQDLVNRFLAETEFRVAVTTERDKQRGGVATGVFLQFTDSRGRHPLSAASGFQRVALGSALRNALAALHAASTGTLVWISIQDEGFGAYDEANLQAARETLVKMAAGRRWLFFITHVGGLQDIADTRINVVPGPGSSTLTIERNAA